MNAGQIAGGAPAWVYALLALLVFLGIRRLRTREVPVAMALLPSIAFLIWSLTGAAALAARAGVGLAAGAWITGAAIGGISGVILPEPRGERLSGGRVRQPGSWLPLILYLAVFVIRFVCGAWGAIDPGQAITATAVGMGVGAALTARLMVGVARWRPAA